MVGKVNKHTFEAVSLLILNKGILDVSIIPVQGQLDWVVPTNLILGVVELSEWVWTYQWQDCDVAVYHLLEPDSQPNQLLILEGNSDIHRLGLQIVGDVVKKQVGISKVKDIEEEVQRINTTTKSDIQCVFQEVQIEGQKYMVPDLDKLAHRLVDLDG